jgi:hypothetical protein
MNGWLIKIDGWHAAGPVRLFAAAAGDPRLALVAVQKVTNAAPRLRVETVGPLSRKAVRKLGLERGHVLELSAPTRPNGRI